MVGPEFNWANRGETSGAVNLVKKSLEKGFVVLDKISGHAGSSCVRRVTDKPHLKIQVVDSDVQYFLAP